MHSIAQSINKSRLICRAVLQGMDQGD